MHTPRRQLGNRGEQVAARWLTERGFDIIDANVQVGRNELDLICLCEDAIVFVEVKTAAWGDYGDPVFKVDRLKRRAIVHAAQRWLMGHPQGERGVRFDIVCVDYSVEPPLIDHRAGAFTADDI